MGARLTREEIEAIRAAAAAGLLAAMTNPKPSYVIDGQAISWAQHRKQLQEAIDWCAEQILAIDAEENGPACEETIQI